MDLSMLFGQLCVKNKSSTSKKILHMKKKFQAALGLGEYAKLCHQFLQLQSLEEMFALFWNCPAAHRFLVSPGAQLSKKEEASELLRVEGNQMYKQNNLEQALKCYNLSIILAPHPKLPLSDSCDNNQGSATGKEGRRESFEDKYKLLSCGYANRSAVFLSMKEYDKCLADIDLAFKYGYSKQLKDKLLSRRERCLKAKQESGLKGENPVFWSLNAKIPPVLEARNPSVPSFSSSLKVVHSHMRGRHVVASRDIAPGEVLAVEKSYCSFIRFDDNMMRACPVCFMRCDQGVPCPDCMVIFCSEDCREKGLERAHGKECKILSYLTGLDIDDDEIVNALRIVVHTTFMELKEKLPVLMKESEDLPAEKLGFDGNNVYDSTDYRSVYHICAYNGRKANNKVFNLCFTVFVLTKVLYESKAFFVDRSGNEISPTNEDLIMAGTALLYHVGHDNRFFEVSDVKVIANSDETENQGIGCALFPSIWLIKHACNSNAAHYNMGQARVVRSILSIPAGSEVTLMYSEGYFCLSLKYRKTLLKARGIDCSCEACENDWPTEDKLPDEVLFKCIKCSETVVELELQPVCLNCNISYSKTGGKRHNTLIKKFWDIVGRIVEAEHRYDAVVLKMKKGQPINKHDFADIRNFIVALEKHVSLPCRAILKTRRVLLNYFFLEK